jgi:hypothetical protein
MTAVAITPAETAREGHAVLHLAIEAAGCETVQAAMVSLGDALDIYAELDGDGLHWEQVYPELRDEPDPDEARGEALRKAADEVGAAATDLIQVMAAHCGTEDEMAIPGVGN